MQSKFVFILFVTQIFSTFKLPTCQKIAKLVCKISAKLLLQNLPKEKIRKLKNMKLQSFCNFFFDMFALILIVFL